MCFWMGFTKDAALAKTDPKLRLYKWLDGTSYDHKTESFTKWKEGGDEETKCACFHPTQSGATEIIPRFCNDKGHSLCLQRMRSLYTFIFYQIRSLIAK